MGGRCVKRSRVVSVFLFDNPLKESACTFCGQCVQTCPTGALGDKKAMRFANEDGGRQTADRQMSAQ
ncbi:MAG: 4Fe-4S binding protein [Caldilineaceae bacterium]|nr:4Fe-4S binding protein [Caldilineaceae bacterium]